MSYREAGVLKKSVLVSGEHMQVVQLASASALTLNITPVRSVAGAYSAGDCVGTIYSLASMLVAAKHYLISTARVKDYSGQGAALQVWIFSDNPAAGAYTDNSAAAPDAGYLDLAKVLAVVDIAASDYTALAAQKFARTDSINRMFQATGNERCLVTTSGAPTYASQGVMPIITLELIQVD